MFKSGDMHPFCGSRRSIRLDDAIPPRYRDARGGIDLEQVQRDRRQAKRQVVRAMIRRLKQLWRSV
ncbi:hypothetical protein JF541_08270 [Marinobacter hydrocarbonoclasticus]|uniref:hypothetical protein n=1 Tax=Marinobacter nauticus TaxID=2743 RepID=UPI001A8D1BE4|nr:hypothetical protein [Marinobacter nauticus]MBN8239135.1 hypothetical protein [Marinobacter nauticus]